MNKDTPPSNIDVLPITCSKFSSYFFVVKKISLAYMDSGSPKYFIGKEVRVAAKD
jgi:hypothetical protein